MKKLINKYKRFVRESLVGMVIPICSKCTLTLSLSIELMHPYSKVAIISGGGSGHEPMHAGVVGMGMLDAVCPGEVFTSPTPQMLEAAKRLTVGILYIVKNYSGDVMNFEMATELARTEGIRVLNILIDDAVKDSLYTQGRRVWVPRCWQKNRGAAAEQGYDTASYGSLPTGQPEWAEYGSRTNILHCARKGTPTFKQASLADVYAARLITTGIQYTSLLNLSAHLKEKRTFSSCKSLKVMGFKAYFQFVLTSMNSEAHDD